MILRLKLRQRTISTYIFIATLWFIITSGLLFLRLNKSQQVNHKHSPIRKSSFLKWPEPKTELLPDISSTKSEMQLAIDAQIIVPSFPAEFLMDPRFLRRHLNSTCARLPGIFDININNVYWQHLTLSTGTSIYLYAAYYDIRKLSQSSENNHTNDSRAIIRILAMINGLELALPSVWCQFWYHRRKAPAFSSQKATYEIIWKTSWGQRVNRSLVPILISCRESNPGPDGAPPRVVSVVEHQCTNATNALRIQHSDETIFSKRKSEAIVVCVKGLTYPDRDMSVRFIEWLELLRLVGAHRVFLYDMALHPRTRATLNHYQDSGFVDVTPLTLPGNQPNVPPLVSLYFKKKILLKRLNEVIPYNDCLYRNLYNYKHVVLLDMDEVILPVASYLSTWQDLLRTVGPAFPVSNGGSEEYASVCAQNVYFFDTSTAAKKFKPKAVDIPNYMHLLTHVVRAFDYTPPGMFVKCFHSTAAVITLHNHYPLRCQAARCKVLHIDTSLGHLQHYRHGCTLEVKNSCSTLYMNNTVVDTTVWKYKERLISAVNLVLRKLGFELN